MIVLTNFEHKTHTGNGNRCKLAKIWLGKTRGITSSKLILWQVFSYFEPLCSIEEQGEKIRNNGLAKISYY